MVRVGKDIGKVIGELLWGSNPVCTNSNRSYGNRTPMRDIPIYGQIPRASALIRIGVGMPSIGNRPLPSPRVHTGAWVSHKNFSYLFRGKKNSDNLFCAECQSELHRCFHAVRGCELRQGLSPFGSGLART